MLYHGHEKETGLQMNLPEIKRPLVIAHRGYGSKYPENTLAAFSAAVDVGAAMVELDVTLTRDRKLIVIHDDTLDRTTDGTGMVSQYDLAELKRFDAGSWLGNRFRGERLPTLEEALDAVGDETALNIEIKSIAYEETHHPDTIENQVIDLIYAKNCGNSVLISSFDDRILKNVRRLDTRLPISIISRKTPDKHTFEKWKKLDLFSWHPQYQIVTGRDVALMHKSNIVVFPYTVNAPKDADQLLQMQVDGMFTDDPALMLRHMAEIEHRMDN